MKSFIRYYVFLVAAAFMISLQFAFAQESSAYPKIRQSLALIASLAGDQVIATGTAFCVYSDNKHSVFLTNRHVIAGSPQYLLIMQYPHEVARTAMLLREGVGARDLAFLSTDIPNVSPVSISTRLPLEGKNVAIAGYARTQLTLARLGLGLTPALHLGTVNALPADGFFIEYDAQTEPGNSGGPLFDPMDLPRFGGHRDKPVEDRRRSVQWEESQQKHQARDRSSPRSSSSRQYA